MSLTKMASDDYSQLLESCIFGCIQQTQNGLLARPKYAYNLAREQQDDCEYSFLVEYDDEIPALDIFFMSTHAGRYKPLCHLQTH